MYFSSIFGFLSSFEPYTKMATSAFGMITNYRQNKKIESVEKDVSKIKDVLGLKETNLSDDELKIISLFIMKSEEFNRSINLVTMEYDDFVNISVENSIDDILMYLESYNFLNVERFISGESHYKLKYEVFINSDLLQKVFNDSMTYSELFRMVVNFMFDNYRRDNILDTHKILEELTLNNFLLNPILFHLDNIGVIKLIRTFGKNDLIADSFSLDKPKLFELYKKLNESGE